MRLGMGRLSRSGSVVVLLALALAGVPTSADATRTLGLSASEFEFNVAAGQSGKGDLVMMNDGDEPFDVFVYSANQVVSDSGELRFEMPDRNQPGFSLSPASWFTIRIPSSTRTLGNLPVVGMSSGSRVPVEFEFTAAKDAPPGDHQVLLFFEMAEPEGGSDGVSAKVSGRIGCRVRIRVQGDVVERLDVRPFEIRQLILGTKAPYVFMIRNEGNVDKIISVRVALLDGNENERYVSQLVTETPVYARSNIEHSGVLDPGLTFGRYTARLTMEYSGEGEQPGQSVPQQIIKDRTVWIVPLWLAIAVIVLIGGLLLWASWRQAVRSAEKRVSKRTRGASRVAENERARARAERSERGYDDADVEVDDPRIAVEADGSED
jgi:hypothetical protein